MNMLSALYLTKSKVRRKLLGILFTNLEAQYYLSELARLVGTSAGNIQRELKPFLQDGLIEKKRKGKLLFYSVSPHHALFAEIRSLVVKTSGIEGALKELVAKEKSIELALLYGSFAKGEEHGASDIDLLLVTKDGLKRLYSKLARLESTFNREINPTAYSPQEFRKRILEKNHFVKNILKEPYHLLKGSLNEYGKESS